MTTKLMAGKRGLVMGVANDHSIAWGIAKTLAAHGAEIAFTYQGDAQLKRLKPLAASIGATILLPADVEDDDQLDTTFDAIKKEWGELDFLVHAIAFSDKNELKGRYVDTSRANFAKSLSVSCYSFTAVARRAIPLMKGRNGAMLTLSYHGARQVMPSYNVMGVAKAALEASVRYLAADLGHDQIRVNAISAGPIRTLAGSVVGGGRTMFRWIKGLTPLGKTIELDHLGGAALYLLSDLSAGVTGEVHYVDAGYNVMGVPPASVLESWSGQEEGKSDESGEG
ncbi:enoyl-[acyl-carrier protein] reductase I [Rhizomicrobium palustre]|uniref:Enoyl-[acyl-carrier-protein] reductase [NADH] n=1 Tax=Rhizomicrobium palustre TaxID=189966 RepID=A0A846MWP0_9PROT|nr:SDR family oxidoreductase [Rhizomicrobium palustre]NIK87968.1 enoyl-[acyl-carrier protein] reductase I [Rhizomicrobium palustre]